MAAKPEKSAQTLAAIVRAALEIAVVDGLGRLSFGEVAKKLDISKSGVFARVGSLETLHNLVLEEYERIFLVYVFYPALSEPRGLPRLNTIMRLWIARANDANSMVGALHAGGSFELIHIDSPLRDRLLKGTQMWRHTLERTVKQALDERHLKPDTDPAQLVFEIFSLMVGFLHDSQFLRDPRSLERLQSAYLRLISNYQRFDCEI